jgi:hypothetical protein
MVVSSSDTNQKAYRSCASDVHPYHDEFRILKTAKIPVEKRKSKSFGKSINQANSIQLE